MRILRKLISIGIGSLTAILYLNEFFRSSPDRGFENSTYINPTLQVVAHRGSSANQLEHTFAAYQSAIDEGCRQIELMSTNRWMGLYTFLMTHRHYV